MGGNNIKFNYLNLSTVISIIAYFAFCSAFPILVLFFVEITLVSRIILIIILLILFLFPLFIIFNKRILINEEGVIFHSFFEKRAMEWREIEAIYIVDYTPFAVTSKPATFICFSTTKHSNGTRISALSKDCIYIRYRKKVENYLRLYWDKEITI